MIICWSKHKISRKYCVWIRENGRYFWLHFVFSLSFFLDKKGRKNQGKRKLATEQCASIKDRAQSYFCFHTGKNEVNRYLYSTNLENRRNTIVAKFTTNIVLRSSNSAFADDARSCRLHLSESGEYDCVNFLASACRVAAAISVGDAHICEQKRLLRSSLQPTKFLVTFFKK